MPFDPKVHVGVAACIINPLDRLLMIERQGAHGAGQWSIVGGWIDYGETPTQAVLRELREEVGVIAATAHYIGTSTHTFESPVDHSLTLFFKIPYTYSTMRSEIKEPDKISRLAWVAYDHVRLLDLFPPFEKFIDAGYRW